jgi:hypothetical protein
MIMKARNSIIFACALTASTGWGLAQQSASFQLKESAFNAGGHPAGGSTASSTHHRLSIDAVGDAVFPAGLTGGSHQVAGGFVAAYPPPGEVTGLRFADAQTLTWNPEPAVGAYHLYRGTLASIAGLSYGACLSSAIDGPAATDAGAVLVGSGFYYLVTARNRLFEEGTKGRSSAGVQRANNAPCP